MRTIKKQRAQELASQWHGGQWSALYQFASSGTVLEENALCYIEEILQEMQRPETALHPFHRSQSEHNTLIRLKNYFIAELKKQGIEITYQDDSYGFPFPLLTQDNPKVKPIQRLQ